MTISLVAAMGRNRVIGNKGKLPWHMPADLKYFRDKTKGKPVIMGRKTFDSMGKLLPNRTNIILTRDRHYKADGCIVADSADEALKSAGNAGEIMVIGGQKIFEQFMPIADRIYLTIIHADFEGDAYFPKYGKEWKEASRERHNADEKNPYNYDFIVLEK